MDFAATKNQQKERLEALRGVLRQQGLDGFFVPIADEYMNEYVPDCAQRLAWLSGFTGSAGLGFVDLEKAALLVDGRYTLQAARQVDDALYDVVLTSKTPLADYLKANVKKGMCLGYDAWLHTKGWLERVRPILDTAGVQLVAVSRNPLDGLWQERPAAPMAPITAHPFELAGETAQDKRARLAVQLVKDGFNAAIITSPASIAWLLNVRGADVPNTPLPLSYVVLYANGCVDWFVYEKKITADVVATCGEGVVRRPQDQFLKSFAALAGKKVLVDVQHSPAAVVDALHASGVLVKEGQDPCELPKACKNKVEIEGMRKAHHVDGVALTRFLCWLDGAVLGGGINEIKAEERLLAFRMQNSAFLYPSFPSISGAGPNGAVVHYRATPQTCHPLRFGELYLIDSGGQYAEGTTDVTRTVALGAPPREACYHFTLVLKGHITLARARFPQGVTGGQLDVLARRALWQGGLDYDHGTGHGVGAFLGVHEGPQSISGRSTVPLKTGMVLSNEPGYYREGTYGIRIENLMVVQESDVQLDGKPMLEFETLTLAPIDKKLIDARFLDEGEKAWLNAYHARVYVSHLPHLDAQEAAWLQQATAPL